MTFPFHMDHRFSTSHGIHLNWGTHALLIIDVLLLKCLSPTHILHFTIANPFLFILKSMIQQFNTTHLLEDALFSLQNQVAYLQEQTTDRVIVRFSMKVTYMASSPIPPPPLLDFNSHVLYPLTTDHIRRIISNFPKTMYYFLLYILGVFIRIYYVSNFGIGYQMSWKFFMTQYGFYYFSTPFYDLLLESTKFLYSYFSFSANVF